MGKVAIWMRAKKGIFEENELFCSCSVVEEEEQLKISSYYAANFGTDGGKQVVGNKFAPNRQEVRTTKKQQS